MLKNRSSLFLAGILALAPMSVWGQSSRGTVNGIVTDSSSAAMTGAKVELKSLTTGVIRNAQSNEVGNYRFDAVDLGVYQITVSAVGFQQLSTEPFEVIANQVRTVDAKLEVGEQKSVVQVVAESVQLQVEAPVRGANVDSTQITQLPVAGRNPVALALTVPGVSTNRAGFGTNTFSVNGGRGRSNNFLIDGTENNDISIAGQAFQINNPDAVQEVSVQTSNYDSEFGRAGGGVVNVITKGGTNEFHGTASFLLDVTNDDATTLNQSIDPEVQKRGKPLPGTEQWWGGTIGGPVVKNKLFFFQSFQELRQRASGSSDVVAPTAAGRATLNSLFPAGRNPRVDLLNQITAGIDGTANPFNVALGDGRPDIQFGLAIFGYPQAFRDRQTTTRVDYSLSAKDQLSGRYLFDDQDQPVSAVNFPSFITGQKNRYQNVLASWTRVISPSVTNELRLPYNRINLAFPNNATNPIAQTMPLYSIAGLTASSVGRSIGGYMGVQTNLPQGRVANNYGLQDTVSWVKGAHSVRGGTELLLQRSRQFAPITERGLYAYAATGSVYTGLANFIDDFGGSNGSIQRDFGNPAYYPSLFRQGYFIQDRWRIKQSVTITLGLRYEYFGLPVNSLRTPGYEGIFNVDPVNFTGPFSNANKTNADKNNFSPAFGLAWNPSADSGMLGRLLGQRKTVIRTGYQIGYDSFFNNIASNAATSSPNVAVTQFFSTAAGTDRGVPNFSQNFPTIPRVFASTDGQSLVLKNLVNPYYQRWSFGIQREITPKTVLDVSYVGSKGTKLFATEQFNPLVPSSMRINPPNIATIPANRLVGRYDPLSGSRAIRTNNGSSIYNSLQVNLSKRSSFGFFGNMAYTWSKLIDYGSEIFAASNAAAQTAVPTIFGGLPQERGISLFDRTHRVSVVYGYDLPWMKQQKGFAGRVIGGWSLSGITTWETGVPVTINNGVDADGIDGANDRPNFNPSGQPGVRAVPRATSPTGYINPDLPGTPAIDPATAQYIALVANPSTVNAAPTGNLGRNTFRSGPTSNWNVNLFKTVTITERFRAEFRTEFYNVFNHPQRGLGSVSPFSPANSTPSSNVTTGPAGQFLNLNVLDGGGRVIRYQLKFVF